MFKNISRAITGFKRQRQTIRELNRLSDRELNDLGISRFDIPWIARESGKVNL
ncbi:hypothetical protein PHIM7_112 [Sinorhizobium phage phiM7]|uniref:YjiS-like domain-containing protein n=3 Tax=Emdodecavirus TaxID=1980937 RepID=S5MB00_9CAUD|nr:hypothetical protein AB690_gp126 [Sinorhizobium phage phiM12]YP_009212366.1 hypothetical protein AVT40_gp126 [Sinorhizobium phage phiN3]YP_009601237.1 hypothetical protein FDH46_gp112 [Sinorhizobium phage phiM7]AKF13019.1 hypothetical protein PHIM19_113 [Sinorhizobium phage phiM19]AGR47803.1 hypothetical protein SmphiM12_171 [Sinorhizobium phage phiM12]AKF12659.1 hypothetical protein PHIM7_112 [Sinorhizobium phage phiM7]AKF13391.1 hypothetical protein PHIN3_126 [Sinorhizobium phage phiN3]